MGVWSEIGDRVSNFEVPILPKIGSIFALLGNIIIPGLGTLIGGAYTDNKIDVYIGLLQFLAAFIIFGWIWSIIWGVMMVIAAFQGGSGGGGGKSRGSDTGRRSSYESSSGSDYGGESYI